MPTAPLTARSSRPLRDSTVASASRRLSVRRSNRHPHRRCAVLSMPTPLYDCLFSILVTCRRRWFRRCGMHRARWVDPCPALGRGRATTAEVAWRPASAAAGKTGPGPSRSLLRAVRKSTTADLCARSRAWTLTTPRRRARTFCSRRYCHVPNSLSRSELGRAACRRNGEAAARHPCLHGGMRLARCEDRPRPSCSLRQVNPG